MTDRLMIAYGLMILLAAGLGAVIWWNIHHSHRRTYDRHMARRRKDAVAAADARRETAAGEGNRA